MLPPARGIVVEVGIGSVLNVPYYPPSIEHLYGIDLSPELLQMARRKTEHVPFPVTLLNQTAEKVPLEDHSVDREHDLYIVLHRRQSDRAKRG